MKVLPSSTFNLLFVLAAQFRPWLSYAATFITYENESICISNATQIAWPCSKEDVSIKPIASGRHHEDAVKIANCACDVHSREHVELECNKYLLDNLMVYDQLNIGSLGIVPLPLDTVEERSVTSKTCYSLLSLNG